MRLCGKVESLDTEPLKHSNGMVRTVVFTAIQLIFSCVVRNDCPVDYLLYYAMYVSYRTFLLYSFAFIE
jgi:hypothetical protein